MKKILLLAFTCLIYWQTFSQCSIRIMPLAVCQSVQSVKLYSQIESDYTVTWSSEGGGSFDDLHSLTPVYTFSDLDRSNGKAILTLTGDPGGCQIIPSATTYIDIIKVFSNAGPDQIKCSSDNDVTLNGQNFVCGSFKWTSSGSGSFVNNADPKTTYLPSAEDIASGSIVLTLQVRDSSSASLNFSASDDMIVTFFKLSNTDLGPDQTVCTGNTFTLGETAVSGSAYEWQSIPVGFNSSSSIITVSPSSTIQYLYKETNGACVKKDTIRYTVNQSPVINAGTDKTVCEGLPQTIGSASEADLTYSWSSIPEGFASTNSIETIAPSASTTYVLTAVAENNCKVTDSVTINLYPKLEQFITRNGDFLYASNVLVDNEWYNEGTILQGSWVNGDNGKMYIYYPGDYFIRSRDEYGCMKKTEIFTVEKVKIGGKVRDSNNEELPNTKVYLYPTQYGDSLTVIDSVDTDVNGYYSFESYYSTVYVAAYPNKQSNPDEMPTYYSDALVFQSAMPVSVGDGQDSINFQTNLGYNPGGTGYFSGLISSDPEAMKITSPVLMKTSSLDFNTSIRLVLIDSLGNPVAYTYTDANGNFQFTNLPYNKYKVWIDGVAVQNNVAPIINLSASAPSASSVKFVLHKTFLEKVTASTGILPVALSSNQLYPNPVKDYLYLNIDNSGEPLNYSIMSSTGEVVRGGTVYGTSIISVSDLQSGMYVFKVFSEERIMLSKIMVE